MGSNLQHCCCEWWLWHWGMQELQCLLLGWLASTGARPKQGKARATFLPLMLLLLQLFLLLSVLVSSQTPAME